MLLEGSNISNPLHYLIEFDGCPGSHSACIAALQNANEQIKTKGFKKSVCDVIRKRHDLQWDKEREAISAAFAESNDFLPSQLEIINALSPDKLCDLSDSVLDIEYPENDLDAGLNSGLYRMFFGEWNSVPRFVPDAYLIDENNKTVVCYEVEVGHSLDEDKLLLYSKAWWVLRELWWDLRLISYDRYGFWKVIEPVVVELFVVARASKPPETPKPPSSPSTAQHSALAADSVLAILCLNLLDYRNHR